MSETTNAADGDFLDPAAPLVNWREYAEIARYGDDDAFVGDEPSVPIIYEPA